MPGVSVVMPTFNRLEYLRAAVASVMAQSFTDWELIIVDDGSGDETREYLGALRAMPRVHVLLLEHSGNPGALRNAGARVARGGWLAFLDSDDLWHPTRLAMQLAQMRAHPERLWSYGAIERIDAQGRVIPRRKPQKPRPQGAILEDIIRWRTGIAMPTVIVRRELFERVGGFDETYPMFEDFDLWLRLAMASPVSALDTPLVSVRHHGEHFSSQGERGLREWLALFERWKPRLDQPRLLRALEAQCVTCIARIAGLQAAAGHRVAALRTLFGGRPRAWQHAAWWSGAMRVILSSMRRAPPAGDADHSRQATR